MRDYEVELGQVTESRDARTQEPFEVTVDIYVQGTADPPVEPTSADHEVVFDVDGDVARFSHLEAHPEFSDLAFVAAKAAANELRDLQDAYEVEDPVERIHRGDYVVLE